MKRAIAQTACKICRVTYPKGAVYEAPYPLGWQREMDQQSGLVIEIDDGPAGKNRSATQPKESEADRKKRLEAYARQKFGVNIDRRKKIETIEQEIAELEAKYPKGNPQEHDPAEDEGRQDDGSDNPDTDDL